MVKFGVLLTVSYSIKWAFLKVGYCLINYRLIVKGVLFNIDMPVSRLKSPLIFTTFFFKAESID